MDKRPFTLDEAFTEADALIVVDPQIDFCPGGQLPVAGGDEIMAGIGRLAARFRHVVVTQDWHPPGTCPLPAAMPVDGPSSR